MSNEVSEKVVMNHMIQKILDRGEMLAKDSGLRRKAMGEREPMPECMDCVSAPFRYLVRKSMDRAKVMAEDNGLE